MLDAAGSTPAEDTLALRARRPAALCMAGSLGSTPGEGSRWPLGEQADPPGFGPGVSRFEAWAVSCKHAAVAQLVRARSWYERGPRFDPVRRLRVDVAQSAERHLAKVEAAGSKPVVRSKPF
jgi:hypothetical protein